MSEESVLRPCPAGAEGAGRRRRHAPSAHEYQMIILITFNLHRGRRGARGGGGGGAPGLRVVAVTTPVLFCNVFAIFNKIPHKSYNFRLYHGYYGEAPDVSEPP